MSTSFKSAACDFAVIPAALARDFRITPLGLMVAAVLNDMAETAGAPSITIRVTRMAGRCGISRRSARRELRRLYVAGWIDIRGDMGRVWVALRWQQQGGRPR